MKKSKKITQEILHDFDEVIRIIDGYDRNIATTICNLKTYASFTNIAGEISKVAERTAIETLLCFKRDECSRESDKEDELEAAYKNTTEDDTQAVNVARGKLYEVRKHIDVITADIALIEDFRNYMLKDMFYD